MNAVAHGAIHRIIDTISNCCVSVLLMNITWNFTLNRLMAGDTFYICLIRRKRAPFSPSDAGLMKLKYSVQLCVVD